MVVLSLWLLGMGGVAGYHLVKMAMGRGKEISAMNSDGGDISIATFPCGGKGIGHVALIMRGCPLQEYEGVLVPGVMLTPRQARGVAASLYDFAAVAEKAEPDLANGD